MGVRSADGGSQQYVESQVRSTETSAVNAAARTSASAKNRASSTVASIVKIRVSPASAEQRPDAVRWRGVAR